MEHCWGSANGADLRWILLCLVNGVFEYSIVKCGLYKQAGFSSLIELMVKRSTISHYVSRIWFPFCEGEPLASVKEEILLFVISSMIDHLRSFDAFLGAFIEINAILEWGLFSPVYGVSCGQTDQWRMLVSASTDLAIPIRHQNFSFTSFSPRRKNT